MEMVGNGTLKVFRHAIFKRKQKQIGVQQLNRFKFCFVLWLLFVGSERVSHSSTVRLRVHGLLNLVFIKYSMLRSMMGTWLGVQNLKTLNTYSTHITELQNIHMITHWTCCTSWTRNLPSSNDTQERFPPNVTATDSPLPPLPPNFNLSPRMLMQAGAMVPPLFNSKGGRPGRSAKSGSLKKQFQVSNEFMSHRSMSFQIWKHSSKFQWL